MNWIQPFRPNNRYEINGNKPPEDITNFMDSLIDEYVENIPQPIYDEIIKRMPIVCVDVAIVYNNTILLIKRRDEPMAGEWWLPGGRLYKGESLEACALRKAKEETSLYCRIGPMLHYQSTIFEKVHSVNFCYLLTASDDSVRLDDTCLDYEWIAGNREVLHPYVKRCVSRAFDWLVSGVSIYEA